VGLPVFLPPLVLPSSNFFTALSLSILATCPSDSSLLTVITVTLSGDLNLLEISQSIYILQEPFSYVGPYIFIKIFFSHVIKALSVLFIRVHDMAPEVTSGLGVS